MVVSIKMLRCSNYGRLIPNEASFLARTRTISDDCLYRDAPFIDNGANAPGRAQQRHLTYAGPGPQSPSSPDLSLFPLTRQRKSFRSKMGRRFPLADTIAPVTDVAKLELATGAHVHSCWLQRTMRVATDYGPIARAAAFVAGVGWPRSIWHVLIFLPASQHTACPSATT